MGRIYHQVRRYCPWQRVSKSFNRNCITYTNVIGQARRAIHAYSNDKRGYIFSLRRLKCVFGQKSKGAQAHLWKLSRGKKITSDDDIGLLDYYYTINNCLISLRLLQYESDLTSTKVLRQATRQLSSKRYIRCVNIVWTFEQLVNQISWLYDGINTQNYPYLPPKSAKQNYPLKDGYITRDYREGSSRKTFINATKIDKQNKTNKTIRRKYQESCLMCSKNHRFFKCPKYRELKPIENFIS